MTRTAPPRPRRPLPTPLPNAGRATFAVVALLSASAVDAVHGVFYGYLLAVWGTLEDTTTIEAIEGLVNMARLVTLVLAAVGFVRWFRRAYGNAIALGHRASFAPGWAIGAWFLPILNLVRPYQIASAMWRHAGGHVGRGRPVGWWWAFWLAANFLARIGASTLDSSNSDTMRLGVQLSIASDVASVVAGVLAVSMVQKLTRAHTTMMPESAAGVFD